MCVCMCVKWSWLVLKESGNKQLESANARRCVCVCLGVHKVDQKTKKSLFTLIRVFLLVCLHSKFYHLVFLCFSSAKQSNFICNPHMLHARKGILIFSFSTISFTYTFVLSFKPQKRRNFIVIYCQHCKYISIFICYCTQIRCEFQGLLKTEAIAF